MGDEARIQNQVGYPLNIAVSLWCKSSSKTETITEVVPLTSPFFSLPTTK